MRFAFLLLFLLGIPCSILGQQPTIFINELMASNVSTNADMVDFGDFSDWVELYNAEDSPIDIGGFYITDNLSNPTKWQIPSNTIIPAKGFYLLWADGFDDIPGQEYIRDWWPSNIPFITKWSHTNFKLSKEGEEVGLFDASGNLIDSIVYGPQVEDISYGRKPNGSENWYFFGEPTPQASNSTTGLSTTEFAKGVLFSEEGGFYDAPISVILTSSNGEGIIRYKLDGSEPTSSSQAYTNPISITSNTILTARVFEGGRFPGNLFSSTYFINESRTLPVFSIITERNYLMDRELGIYRNTLKEREIPINLEYFPVEGERGFSQRVGIRIGGENIFRFAQKPLNIYANGDYGESEIEYQVFDHLPFQAYKRLYLRNSGDDWPYTMIRDGMISSILRGEVSNSTQAYRPSVLYLNGEYWGIYNLREKLDKQYFSLHYSTAEVDLDHLESNGAIIEGDNSEYLAMLDFASENDLSNPENYSTITSQIDVHNLMDFVITQSYLANSSWGHNREMWRDRGNDNKWRWVLVDMDRGFNDSRIGSDQIGNIYSNFELFRDLTANTTFLNEFIQRYSERLNTTLSSNRIISIIDSLQAQIEPEMPRHIEKWGNYIDSLSIDEWGQTAGISSISSWNNEVETFRTFARGRSVKAIEHLQDQFDIDDQVELTITSNIGNNGKVDVNAFFKNIGEKGIYFSGVPLPLKAYAPPGFSFKQWRMISRVGLQNEEVATFSTEEIEVELTTDTELIIEFEATSNSFVESSITQSTSLTKANSPYFVNENVIIESSADLIIEEGVEVLFDENKSILVKGALNLEGSEDQPVQLKPYYPNQEWVGLIFDNASGESNLNHVKISEAKGIENDENFFAAVSALNSTVNLFDVHIDDVRLPVSSQFSTMKIENSTISNVTMIGDYLNVNGGNLWVLNSIFEGNNIEDMDAIDIGLMEGTTIIDGNIFRNFVGDNSDGIDVGDASEDVQITNNIITNCGDKSVSIGQGSRVYIAYNIFSECNLGVGIKDEGSFGEIVNNTFYKNNIGVAVFEKVLNRGGGSAEVSNSIFSNSHIASFTKDEFSSISINYSISDTEALEGTGNLYGDIKLINPVQGVYHPQIVSPVLGAGDPNTPIDGGGRAINMGALDFQGVSESPLVINEINYNSSDSFDTDDWVEFVNSSRNAIDISNWTFIDASHKQTFSFKAETILGSKEYVVIARDLGKFSALYPNVEVQSDTMTTGLSGSGESLYLYNSSGYLVDSLTYLDSSPWPTAADGNGSTLELMSPEFDNGLPEFWESSIGNGTPGAENSTFITSNEDLEHSDPESFVLYQNYPNPFNPSTKVSFQIPRTSRVTLQVFDVLGRKIATLIAGEIKVSGSHQVTFDASTLSSGLYIYRLEAEGNVFNKTMMLIK